MSERLACIEQILETFQTLKQSLSEGFAFAGKKRITPSQGFVLHFVAKTKRSSVKEVAEKLYITSSAATQLIDALVKNGLLQRSDNPDDHRGSILLLTRKAEDLFRRMKEHGVGRMKDVFSTLSDEELETYLRLNQKIISGLKK
jgi:DNA-binding MarR family transcriptional regulator